jgi:GH18 family chitinase
VLLALCLTTSFCVYADNTPIYNMAYVEVNDNKLSNTGCYLRADNAKPFFNMVGIFAANINGSDPNKPEVYFNPQVDALLNHSDQVNQLQNKGIKVLLTLLGNHKNAGWSCMTDKAAIEKFADTVVNTVYKYHLDGVDIDDEYSSCIPNSTSMIRIAQAIKKHPGFKGKILSKALFADRQYFNANYEGAKLADFLDYGWEMTYGYRDFARRLDPYVKSGVPKKYLALGESAQSSTQGASGAVSHIMKNNFGGMMVYNVRHNSQGYLSKLAQAEFNTTVTLEKDCISVPG